LQSDSWLFWAAPAAVVNADTMLPMSSPEPTPVEEITVLAAFVAVDEIVEPICIALIPIGRYIGTPDQDLSKRRTNMGV